MEIRPGLLSLRKRRLAGRRQLTHVGVLAAGLAMMLQALLLIPGLPASATTPVAAAQGSTVIDDCTIVPHPDPAHFTNCPGAKLAGADLSGLDLKFANLAGADLSGANLSGSNLSHSHLSTAVLGNCHLVVSPVIELSCAIAVVASTEFAYADLSQATMLGVDFSSDDLVHSSLSGGQFVECLPPQIYPPECVRAAFDDSRLEEANLAGAATRNCLTLNFGSESGTSYCGGVPFSGAELSYANLSGDNLSWSDLSGAHLLSTVLTGAVFGECAPSIPDIPACSSANLDDIILRSTSMSGLHLNGAHLQGAELSYADMTGADLTPLLFDQGLAIFPTVLDGARLTADNLTRANLMSASMKGTVLHHDTWASTTCPDGTNSDHDGGTCAHNLG